MKTATVLFVGVSLFLCAQVAAQPPAQAPKNVRVLGQTQLSPRSFGLVRLPAIKTFKPLVFQGNGKPLDPNQKLKTVDGKELTIREAQEGQDTLERSLNKEGYSLYTDEDKPGAILSIKPTSAQFSFKRQSESLKRLVVPKSIGKNLPGTSSATKTKIAKVPKGGAIPKQLDTAALIKAAEEKKKQEWEDDRYKGDASFERGKTVAFEVGSAEWFAVSAQGGVLLKASADERSARASVDLNAVLLNNSLSLVHGVVEVRDTLPLRTQYAAPQIRRKGGRYQLRAEVSVLGKDLIAPLDQTGDTVGLEKRFSETISFGYEVTIPIIPGVSAVGRVGAAGEGGVLVAVRGNAGPQSGIEFSASPFVNSAIFAEVGVSVGFPIAKIEGGITANLTLMNYQVDFVGKLTPTVKDYNDIPHYALSAPLTVSHSLSALDGSLDAFVRLGYWWPSFTNPFRIKYKDLFRAPLLAWEGIKEKGTLIEYEPDAVLLPVPVKGALN